MSEAFYTSVTRSGNHIQLRGWDEKGGRIHERFLYSPTLFVPSNEPTGYKTIFGKHVLPKNFDTIYDAKNFLKKYEGVENFPIYGNQSYEYCFISDIARGKINADTSKIRVGYLDIETAGKESPQTARRPITAFSIEVKGNYYILAYKPFTGNLGEKSKYIECRDEIDMIEKFLLLWRKLDIDVISGWNVSGFDIPYIINRIRILMGDDAIKRMSPWGYISEKEVFFHDQSSIQYVISGIATLDYLELYRKFAPNPNQENYKLNTIANIELGERKVSYDEYGSLDNLYEKDFNKFIEYNKKDVELVKKLESKLKLLELVFTIAYMNKVNYSDVFQQVRMWDAITFNFLRNKKIAIPPKVLKTKTEAFKGAFVKLPKPNLYSWVASYDLNSLYPHIIAQVNISPETIVPSEFRSFEILDIVNKKYDTTYAVDAKLSIAGNGHHYRKDKQGFTSEIIMAMYVERKAMKAKKIEAEKLYQLIEAEIERRGIAKT